MSTETGRGVRFERMIPAQPQAVWDAWTKPEEMKRWSCPAPGGTQTVESDLRVGGSFTIHMTVDGQPHTAFGTYKEIDEPRRLVYTWDWREEGQRMGETTVTVELSPVGDGTRLVLVHDGFPADEAREGHETGWGLCLGHFEGLFA